MLSPLLYDDVNGQLVDPVTGARSAGPGAGTEINWVDNVVNPTLKAQLAALGRGSKRFHETATGTEYLYFVPSGRDAVVSDNAAILVMNAVRGSVFDSVSELFATDVTSLTTVPYSQETVQPTGAVPAAVGDVLASATWTLVATTAPVSRIGVKVPLSDVDLAAIPNLRAKALLALPYMVNNAIDNALLNGSGTTPALKGVLLTTGVNAGGVCNQGADTIADPLFSCVRRGIRVVEAAVGFQVDAIVMNPADWDAAEGTETGDGATTIGTYSLGQPNEPVVRMLWGRPVFVTPAVAAKTVLVGCFKRCAKVHWKHAVAIDNSGANVATGEASLALAVEVPKGFAKCLLQ